MQSDVPMPAVTSLNIILDIFFRHHVAHSRISVFHTDLSTIQRALLLHAIPHTNLNLIQCRRLLIHHIATGACADHAVDASTSPRPDHSACRALCQDFDSAAHMSKVLNVFFGGAADKQLSTESLLHIVATLNISVSGVRNIRFKLRAAIRQHAKTIHQ
jgi:hypothetical protein